MIPASRLSTEFYNIHWVRGLHARISTIMNEWCLPWSEVTSLNKWSQRCSQHQHFYKMEPKILKYYNIHWVRRLRLWMSDVSLQFWCSQHQHSLMEPKILKFYNIHWVRQFIHDYKWVVSSMTRVYNFEWVESTLLPSSHSLQNGAKDSKILQYSLS